MRKLFWLLLFLSVAVWGQTPPYTILNQNAPSTRPYPVAYYNQRLPNSGCTTSPCGPMGHLMPNSDSMVAAFMQSGSATDAGAWNSPGSDDGQHKPLYFGQTTDPVYALAGCTSPMTALNGTKFHAPNGAQFNQGSFDKEIAFWDQTSQQTIGLFGGTCTAASCFALTACPGGGHAGTSGDPCPFTVNGGYCSADIYNTGRGIGGGDAASTAGLSPFANIIRLTEIVNVHHINHGLRGVVLCSGTDGGLYTNRVVFPATQLGGTGANPCTATGTAEPRPPNGTLMFTDYTQGQLDCIDPSKPGTICAGVGKIDSVQFELVEALTLYGLTFEDTGNGESVRVPSVESEQAYYFYDTRGYSGSLAVAQAFETYMGTITGGGHCGPPWCTVTNRSGPTHSLLQWNLTWAGIPSQGGKAFWQHLHLADQCVAIGLQGMSSSGGVTACASPSGSVVANLSSSLLTFAPQAVGVASATQTVSLTNASSTVTVNIVSQVMSPGSYSFTTTCGLTLAPLASCNYVVTFTPTTTGTLNSTLTITTSASNSPNILSLTGTGVQGSLITNPLTLSFVNTNLGSTTTTPLGISDNFGLGSLSSLWAIDTGVAPGNIAGVNNASFSAGNVDLSQGMLGLKLQQTSPANSYTTTFPVTENPISQGGIWTNGQTTGLDWGDVSTTPGKARGNENLSHGFGDSTAVLNSGSGTWSADQSIQATVFIVGTPSVSCGQEVELHLRAATSAHVNTGYEISYSSAFGSFNVVKWLGPVGSFTVLKNLAGEIVHNGDVVKATMVGSTITAFLNGVQITTVTDTTYTSGNPGIGMNYSQNTGCTTAEEANYGFSSFTANNIGSPVNSVGAEIRTQQRLGYGTYRYTFRASSTAATPTGTGVPVSGQVSSGFQFFNNSQTEIDSPEIEGQSPNLLEWTNFSGVSNSQATTTTPGFAPDQAQHTYTNTWSPGSVVFSVDGTPVSTHTLNVPIIPAFALFNHWGTNTSSFGGVATVGTNRTLYASNFSFTPLSNVVFVYNQGTSPLTFTSVPATTGDFAVVSTTCPVSPTTLAVGASCTVTLSATPTVSGQRSGSLVLANSGPTNPMLVPLSVLGVGGVTPTAPGGFVLQRAAMGVH